MTKLISADLIGRSMERKLTTLALLLLAGCSSAFPQNVLTGNYDNARTNANLSESQLNPATVTPVTFKQIFTLSVDGQIYAQPLYMQNVQLPGGPHNIVFVATMHNSVFAFDADAPATPLWTVNLGPSVPTSKYSSVELPYTDIALENGILSTPVIDPATGTMYVVAATLYNGNYYYRLHALDVTSGAERFGGPVVIKAQVPGVGDGSSNGAVAFNALQHLQRPALLLANGLVYISFGSHGDMEPYHGWMVAYSAANLQNQTAVFNASPNGSGGSIWQSGRGPAADSAGNIYAVTSNGTTDERTAFSSNVLNLDPLTLSVKDWFAPFNFQFLNDDDDDLGSCGAVVIEGTNYLLTAGKQGIFYLLDRNNLGHLVPGDSQILQSVNTNVFGIFNVALWNRADGPILYLHTVNSPISAYKLVNGRFTSTPFAQSMTGFGMPFQGMAVSANGDARNSGLLWVTAPSRYPLPAHSVLHAYSAQNLIEVWNSDMPGVGALGAFSKFANPTIANGKVYVPTASNQLTVYGTVFSDNKPPVLTSLVNGASLANGPIAPGEIVQLGGQNLGPATLVASDATQTGVVPSNFNSVQVTFNGIAAPILYASADAVGAIVPYEIAGMNQVDVQVTYNGQTSTSVAVPLAVAAPGVFASDSSGSGPAQILNHDGSSNSPDNPASAGETVTVFWTGGGTPRLPLSDGAINSSSDPLAVQVTALVGGEPARLLYAGAAVGKVAGTEQLTLKLPTDLPTGDWQIEVNVNGQISPATTTVSIR